MTPDIYKKTEDEVAEEISNGVEEISNGVEFLCDSLKAQCALIEEQAAIIERLRNGCHIAQEIAETALELKGWSTECANKCLKVASYDPVKVWNVAEALLACKAFFDENLMGHVAAEQIEGDPLFLLNNHNQPEKTDEL